MNTKVYLKAGCILASVFFAVFFFGQAKADTTINCFRAQTCGNGSCHNAPTQAPCTGPGPVCDPAPSYTCTSNGGIDVTCDDAETCNPTEACDVKYLNSCTSPNNACGQHNTGTIQCDGTCSATTPANPAGYGDPCNVNSDPNSCGQVQSNPGTIQCDGISCSATKPNPPANPVGYGANCTSGANSCNQTNTGTIGCDGVTCSATTPANPAGYGASCTSDENACGMTSTGTIGCDGITCSATKPLDSACPQPDPGCSAGSRMDEFCPGVDVNGCAIVEQKPLPVFQAACAQKSAYCAALGMSCPCVTITYPNTHGSCSGTTCTQVQDSRNGCTSTCANNAACAICDTNAGKPCNDGNACHTGATIQCNSSCGGGVNAPVDGACGTANGGTFASAPASNLCTVGNPINFSGSGPWTWGCSASCGGNAASCSANYSATVVNGVCGSANKAYPNGSSNYGGDTFCQSGTANPLSPSFPAVGTPASWTCQGSGPGHSDASCGASQNPPINNVTASIWADSTSIISGQSTVIHWKVNNATSASIKANPDDLTFYGVYGNPRVVGNTNGSQDNTGNLTQTTTYTLTANGPGGPVVVNVTVNVSPSSSISLVSLTPNSGSSKPSETKYFTLVVYDSVSSHNINVVKTIIDNAGQGSGSPTPNGCAFYWNNTLGNISLYNNAGTGIVGSNTPGPGGGVLSNSQCSIDTSASSVIWGGKNITYTIAVSFTSNFLGNKDIWEYAEENPSVVNTGWQKMGTWTVAYPPPALSLTVNTARGAVLGGGTIYDNGDDDTPTVTWSSTYTNSCTVTSNNGDNRSGTNGSFAANDLGWDDGTGYTWTYTLSCAGKDGSHPSIAAVVKIPPAPGNLQGTCPAPGNAATLTWNAPTGFTDFMVQNTLVGTGPFYWNNDYVGTTYNIPNNYPNTLYPGTLKANNQLQTRVYTLAPNGAYSGAAAYNFSCQPAACGAAAQTYNPAVTAFSGAYCSIGNPNPNPPTFPYAGQSASWTCSGTACSANRSCVAVNYQSGTSGFSLSPTGPTAHSLTVNPGQTFYAFCDYGALSNSIWFDNSSGITYSWAGWNGTAAVFSATAPATPGSYSFTCGSHIGTVSGNPALDACLGNSNPIGAVTDAPNLPPDVYFENPSVSATPNNSYTWPDDGSGNPKVSGSAVHIQGWALDNKTQSESAISSVTILVDGVQVGGNVAHTQNRPDVCAAYPGRPDCNNVGFDYTWDSTTVANGLHTITIQALDSDGSPGYAATRTIRVARPPTATLLGTVWDNWSGSPYGRSNPWVYNNSSGPIVAYESANYQLSWSSTYATACTLDGISTSNNGGPVGTGGTDNTYIAPASNTLPSPLGNWNHTYVLSCTGPGGTATSNLDMSIPPQPINPTATCPAPGTTATLSWTAPAGYTHFYVRNDDITSGTWTQLSWYEDYVGISYTIPYNDPLTEYPGSPIPGHQYVMWIHSRDSHGAWSTSEYVYYTCQSPACTGQTGTVTLSASPIEIGNNTTASVAGWSNLAYTVAPSGIASVSGSTLTGQNGGTASVSATGQAPNGAAGCSVTTDATLNVKDFSLSATSSPPSIIAGNSSTVVVNVNAVNGNIGGLVTVSPPGSLPAGWSISPATGSAGVGGTVTFTVSTTNTTAPSTQALVFTGVYNGISRTAPTNLTVTSPLCPAGSVSLSGTAVTVGNSVTASPSAAGFTGGTFGTSSGNASVSGAIITGQIPGTVNISGNPDWNYSNGATGCSLTAAALTVDPGVVDGSTPVNGNPTLHANQASCPTTGVVLTWTPGAKATGYNIYRHTSNSSSTAANIQLHYPVQNGNVGNQTYTDPTAPGAGPYFYWVESYDSSSGLTSPKSAADTNTDSTGNIPIGISANVCVSGTGPANIYLGNGTCPKITLYWDPVTGASGYNIYRYPGSGVPPVNGSFDPLTQATPIASNVPLATSGSPYTDNSTVGGQAYYYWVSGIVGGVQTYPSPDAAHQGAGNQIGAIACTSSLGRSDKVITAVNGSTVSSGNGQCQNSTPYSGPSLSLGDKLSFRIDLCNNDPNTSNATATNITLVDTFINLATSSKVTDFNAKLNGTTALIFDGTCTGGNNLPSQNNHYCVYGTAPNQTLQINLKGHSNDLPPKTGYAYISFDAVLSVPPGFNGTNSRFYNSYTINDSGSPDSKLISWPFYAGKPVPTIIEVP